VGSFYHIWHDQRAIYDNTKILAANPANPAWGPSPAFHYTTEPLLGYYRSTDPWVIRRHAQWLSDAGVDFIALDLSNSQIHDEELAAICSTYTRIRAEGGRTPLLVPMTNDSNVVILLFQTIFSNNKYPGIWFQWQGKPLMMGNPNYKFSTTIKNFFTWRESWAFTDAEWGDGKDKWPFLDKCPQRASWHTSTDQPEFMAVGAGYRVNGNIGRSFSNGVQPAHDANYLPTDRSLSGKGLYFQECWDRALGTDPQVVFNSGWNEFKAQHFITSDSGPFVNFAGTMTVTGDDYFIALFNQEYGREVEPIAGAYKDNYYMQFTSNARRHKGSRAIPTTSAPQQLTMGSSLTAWASVTPTYWDDLNDISDRNSSSIDGRTPYKDTSGRNDIDITKVTRDATNLYFYARTQGNLTDPLTSANWMLLYLNTDQGYSTGWQGYDYLLLRTIRKEGAVWKGSIEKNNGAWSWTSVGEATLSYNGKELQLSVPRNLLGVAESKGLLKFDFKWADNIPATGTVHDFYTKGDAAPNSRFNYRYMETATFAAPVLTSPIDDATGISTSPKMVWQASTGATSYQLQVSTDSTFATIPTNLTGLTVTSKTLSGLNNATTFFWKVRAVQGNTNSPWSIVRSFRTVQALPEAPALSLPAGNATQVSIAPTLSWSAATGAATYTLQVSTSNAFTSFAHQSSGLSGTSKAISGLANGTTYYWRVAGINATGTGPWSTARSLTTLVAAPAQVTLESPAASATGLSVQAQLKWNSALRAATYELQVTPSSNFSTILQSLESMDTLETINGLSNYTTYYWRVRATNVGGAGPWSTSRSFRTIVAAPEVPLLLSPNNNATGSALKSTLQWSASARAQSYHIQTSTAASFGTLLVNDSNLTSLSLQMSAATYNTTYYWRVRAKNNGGVSAWSSPWSLTTVVVPSPAPLLASPADHAIRISISPTLNWDDAVPADSYQIQVGTDSLMGTLTVDQAGILAPTTAKQVSGLLNLTKYYWRVRATSAGGIGPWSEVRSFTTLIALPAATILVGPVNFAEATSPQPDFQWTSTPRATSYQLQVGLSSTLPAPLVDLDGLADTGETVVGLDKNSTYYWRVRGSNEAGNGAWSPVWSFTTEHPQPSMVLTRTPSDGDTVDLAGLTLTWFEASPAILRYTVELDTSSSFRTPFRDTTVADTVFTPTGLEEGLSYYWRVKANNNSGWGLFSVVKEFYTAVPAQSSSSSENPSSSASSVRIQPIKRQRGEGSNTLKFDLIGRFLPSHHP
jgi:hypothetical protein